jgi:hypothetical protein
MKTKVMTDVTLELDPPSFYYRDAEHKARTLQEDFIRDHRSQDPVTVSVRRVYEDQCSFCHRTWEELDDGEPACCQAAQDEWLTVQRAVVKEAP